MASPAPSFPGYRVLDVLGQGGMGQVYLAEDEVLGRRVAIKTILPAVSGEGAHRARFLREARAMATVEHPRVVRVYSFGETAGRAYFVMELVEGETLAARLQRTPRLPVEEALRIAREVAEALAAAWARGLIHRDVKPSNIILDAEGHVHVADFGLARPVETGADPSITREGAFVGSPHYVAPEQVRAQTSDFRTDIYSLGIVLYEMLAGRRPFDGPSAMDVVTRHLNEPPPPLRAFAPDTPEPVAHLVETMTAKSPALRPASYPTLIASLSGTRAGDAGGGASPSLPTSTLPTAALPSPPPAARSRGQRARRVVAAVVVAVVALGAAVAVRDRFGRASRPPGDFVVALAPFYGGDTESATEAQALLALVESEAKRILSDEEGRSVAVTPAREPARSAREARHVGEQVGADAVLWGEVLSFRGDVEVQATLTPVAEQDRAASRKLGTLLFERQQGSPLEARRSGAAQLAEAVARMAAQEALARGRPGTALALLAECRATAETLGLRALAFERLGRADDAAAARRGAEELGR